MHDSTTSSPAGPRPAPAAGACRDEHGLISLEWLLVVAAIAGLAGMSVVTVQRVVDDTSEVPPDPAVRFIDAEIAAAFLAEEANEEALTGSYTTVTDAAFDNRCQVGLRREFDDVVHLAQWTTPVTRPPLDPVPARLDVPAICALTPELGLGG